MLEAYAIFLPFVHNRNDGQDVGEYRPIFPIIHDLNLHFPLSRYLMSQLLRCFFVQLSLFRVQFWPRRVPVLQESTVDTLHLTLGISSHILESSGAVDDRHLRQARVAKNKGNRVVDRP
jgi:hypothetical protein